MVTKIVNGQGGYEEIMFQTTLYILTLHTIEEILLLQNIFPNNNLILVKSNLIHFCIRAQTHNLKQNK